MAFCNRFGSLVRQTVTLNGSLYCKAPMTYMLNAARYMSSSTTKLFIGGLSYGTDDQSLKDAFSGFGDVVEARVITDRDTGRSRGFGFVNFASDESASSAITAMDGQPLNGRNIRVSYANERPSTGGGGAGGGGFGSRGYGGNFGNTNDGF
ncbi:hypothetical protein NMG60_11017324 [Bertholletia excelsa]